MTDNTSFFKMLERMLRAGKKRAGNADEHDLQHFASLKDLLEDQIREAVCMQRSQGKSWADIGNALGVSKQAAFKRFS